MYNKATSLFIILSTAFTWASLAQNASQLRGRIVDEYGNTINSASIFNKTDKNTALTKGNGNFSLLVKSGDTLIIQSSNYIQAQYIIPPKITDLHFQNFKLKIDREQMLLSFQAMQSNQVNVLKPTTGMIRLAGRITGVNEEPLKDVNIIKRNSFQGSVSNANGMYGIFVNVGDTVEFSFIGHAPQIFVVEPLSESTLLHNVMLSSQAIMLDNLEVKANAIQLDLNYKTTGMDAEEAGRNYLRQQALQTDKTYISTFGVSTARMGGIAATVDKIGSLFGADKHKRVKQQEMSDRQNLMRKAYLQKLHEEKMDSLKNVSGEL